MIKLLALAASGFVMVFLAVFSPLFEIKSVTFNDDAACIKNSQKIAEDNLIGESLIFLNSQEIAQVIKNKFACIETIDVNRQFPSTVQINIQSKRPIAKIAETEFHVTKDGLLIRADDSVQIPTIFLPTNFELNVSQKLDDKNILFALEIIDNLLKSDFVPTTIRIVDEDQIAVYGNKDILVIFSSYKNPIKQVDSLQLILVEAKIDATKIGKIDMRFEKPVISSKK